MSLETVALLFAAGFVAGALNAVAGGGTLITFPALMAAGLPPVVANATSAVAQWPGYLASTWVLKRELLGIPSLRGLGAVSIIGGLLGGYLVTIVPGRLFSILIPWLILLATLLFWQGQNLMAWLGRDDAAWPLPVLLGAQFLVSVYGGFFGGGMGVMMLALFALALPGSLLRLNALKNALSVLVSGVAVAAFVAAGLVVWSKAGILLAGSIAGGVGGARLARRIPSAWLKAFVVGLGFVLTFHFFRQGD